MNKDKKLIAALAGAAGVAYLLFGSSKANAAEFNAAGAGIGESTPPGSSGGNTFTSLLANALEVDRMDNNTVDQSVRNMPGIADGKATGLTSTVEASPTVFQGPLPSPTPIVRAPLRGGGAGPRRVRR